MGKYKAICLSIIALALVGVATAQKSQVHSPTAKPDPNLTAATKPLTPKSAMPAAKNSSSPAMPAAKSNANANKELSHLERQQVHAGGANKSGPGAAKSASTPKSSAAAKDSGINATYEKPKAGRQAATPGAHSANSSKPRVTKN
jgi:hypothetical protein